VRRKRELGSKRTTFVLVFVLSPKEVEEFNLIR